MKLKDPETGNIYDSIDEALEFFCTQQGCCTMTFVRCPFENKTITQSCLWWAGRHPYEAAKLMGYEILDEDAEQEGNMEENKKPRICDVLGVDVFERFSVVDQENGFNSEEIMIDGNGNALSASGTVTVSPYICAIHAINHPEKIRRKSKLTENEIAICKSLGAKWVSKDEGRFGIVQMWEEEPQKVVYKGHIFYERKEGSESSIATAKKDKFPSIAPGELICVEDCL